MSGAGRFLERWSRLKRQGEATTSAPAVAEHATAASPVPPAPVVTAEHTELPPVESLDLASDFSAFLKKEVSESLRRAALRKLFSDPHFNRMDGLDIYIDDYSTGDPIPAELMQKLRQFDTFLRDDPRADPVADVQGDAIELREAGGDLIRPEDHARPEGSDEASDASPSDGTAAPE